MIKFEIKSRYTGAVQFEAEIDASADTPLSVKIGLAVRWAVSSDANLGDADLRGADLGGANLVDANLGQDQRATITPALIENLHWPIMITDRHIKIGCEVYTTEEWAAFTDKEICALDGSSARKFWDQWKVPLLAMARAHQSGVAGGE